MALLGICTRTGALPEKIPGILRHGLCLQEAFWMVYHLRGMLHRCQAGRGPPSCAERSRDDQAERALWEEGRRPRLPQTLRTGHPQHPLQSVRQRPPSKLLNLLCLLIHGAGTSMTRAEHISAWELSRSGGDSPVLIEVQPIRKLCNEIPASVS